MGILAPFTKRRPSRDMEAEAMQPPPSPPPLSAAERAAVFRSLSPADLFDQVGAPDIRTRVIQVLDRLSPDPVAPGEYQLRQREAIALCRPYCDSWCALTWFAWRFRPVNFLVVGGDPVRSAAMVALNSRGTAVVCCPAARPDGARVARELARCGYRRPITAAPDLRGLAQPTSFAEKLLRTLRHGKAPAREYDLISVGAAGGAGLGLDKILARCALGGMVVFDGGGGAGDWEGLGGRYDGFRFFAPPTGPGTRLALRIG